MFQGRKIKFLSFTDQEYQSKPIQEIVTLAKKEYIISISGKIEFKTKSSEKMNKGIYNDKGYNLQ